MGNNVSVEGVVNLDGLGFVNKPSGRFAPGEYKRLVNMEWSSEGYLSFRPSLKPVANTGATATFMDKPRVFIGEIYNKTVVRRMLSATEGAYTLITETTSNSIPMTGSTSVVTHPNIVSNFFVGCFAYSGRVYWISVALFNTAGVFTYQLLIHRTGVDIGPGDAIPTTYAGYTHHNAATWPAPSTGDTYLVDYFMHKNRLWIVMSNGTVYFSKATDPLVWTAPDGGFFNFTPQIPTSMVYVKDTIYLATNQGLSTISYSIDPNTDSSITTITNSFTPSDLVVYKDTVLFVESDTLYSVQNTYIQRVRYLGLRLSGAPTYMRVYGNYVFFSYTSPDLVGVPRLVSYLNNNTFKTLADQYDVQPTYYYVLNMDTSCVWELDFHDMVQNDGVANSSSGNIIDLYFNTWSQLFYVLTWHRAGAGVERGWAYVFNDFLNPLSTVNNAFSDKVLFPVGIPYQGVSQTINANVEVDSYVPDGNEIKVKKFRNLVLEAKLPQLISDDGPAIKFAFGDSSSYTPPIPLSQVVESSRPPTPYRFPINQRARALTIKIQSKVIFGLDLNNQDPDYTAFFIHGMNVFWSYLQRLPAKRNERVDV